MSRFAAGALAFALAGLAVAADPADQRLRDVMDAAKRRAAGVEPAPIRPETEAERQRFLAQGEAALAHGQVEAAIAAFDRAAGMRHAADSEMGLVRAYMQGGEYRRAVAFVAHTASAHRDAPGGAALYAWLLYVGGQGVHAERMLDEARSRFGSAAVLQEVRTQVRSGSPLARGPLLQAPARMAPFDASTIAPGLHVAGSAVLVDEGRRAIAPLAAVPASSRVWLRNALGEAVTARVERRNRELGLVVLHLDKPLPPGDSRVAERDPFPGSPAFAIEYVASGDAQPRWPVLRSGFLGAATSDGKLRDIGVEMPAGPRGGPVYDQGGRLVGVALSGNRVLTPSQLRRVLGQADPTPASAGPVPRVAVEQIYEASMRGAVQVLAER
ncbi:hypothetical protein DSM104443_02022 [Usitatibacter rugosus]|uniref:Trypsin-like peptidase n=1 Tax=Usitatibacter rugosus TaxID=2732067 RepID=A0A6M4GV87_9PROT|nr:tetratricopeptide repeat protein [Usitatibacter rugosus]QJR10952.1 hypothetical protein DSM104443_02022 [Usitatibacter rugosus]